MTTASTTYSNAEWDLIHGIMNRIEAHLPAVENASAVDLAKVQSLVLRTYQDQNLPVTAEMISQICKAMTHALPTQAVDHNTLMGRKNGPMARAAEAVQRVQNHRPLTTVGLMQKISGRVTRERNRQKSAVHRFAAALVFIPIATAAVLAPLWSFMGALGVSLCIAGAFLGWVITLIGIAGSDKSLGQEDMKKLKEKTELALQALETESDGYASSALLQLLNESMGFPYSHALLTDQSSRWEQAHRAASEDRSLRNAWTAWLQGDAPIREGDVALLLSAAKAIQEAKKVMKIYDPFHGVASQSSRRTEALERMQASV